MRFARPEIVLAHKAKWRQSKDHTDFDATWPTLGIAARAWLHDKVAALDPEHPWLTQMR